MEAVLGAALIGIEESMIPAVPVVGNCYEADVPHLPDQWATGNTIGVELIYYARDFFQPTVLPGQFTCFQSQLNLVNCWRHTARIRQGKKSTFLERGFEFTLKGCHEASLLRRLA